MFSTALHALLGMATVLVMHVLTGTALVGFGLGARRAFGVTEEPTLEDAFVAFWTGFAFLIALLILWNFLWPVGPAALALVLVSGWLCLFRVRPAVGPLVDVPRWAWVLAGLFWLWVANLALARVTAWDSGLYHMQGVRWARSYPTVPGVANVFGPMGFNNATFLYDAMMDALPAVGRGWHFANSLLFAAFGMQTITGTARYLGDRTAHHGFWLPLVLAAVSAGASGNVSSFVTHLPAGLLIIGACFSSYRALSTPNRSEWARAHDLFVAVVLATAAVAAKTSAAVFAATLALFALYIARFRDGGLAEAGTRALTWGAGFAIVTAGAFTARGIVLSGYPMFPTPTLKLPVAWAAPLDHARAEFEFVVHSARNTTKNFDYVAGRSEGMGAWMSDWLPEAVGRPYDMAAPFALSAVALLWLAWVVRRARPSEYIGIRSGFVAIGPLLVAITAWFWVAPMPTYGGPFAWGLLAVTIAQGLRLRPLSPIAGRRVVVAALSLSAAPVVTGYGFGFYAARGPGEYASRLLRTHMNTPDRGYRFQQNRPRRTLREYHTASGLVLNVPTGNVARCWDAPLPCTPNPAPNLRLREPGNMESGFVVEGGHWQMLDWPEPWRPHLLPAMRERWAGL